MVEELDKDQLKLLKNAFEAFDTEKAGVIETSMIGMILEMLGQTLDDKSLKAVIKTHDPRGTGKLNFEEFALLASSFVEVEEDIEAIRQELKEAFRLYDKEGRGYLTLEVLKDILHELDDKITDEDLDMMIDEIDADGSGTVDFEEFMEVMTELDKEQLKILQNAFNAFDSDHTGFIHMEDIGTIIEMLGQKLDDGTLKALIREHDPRGTGKLNFERFAVLAGNYVEVEEDVEAIRQELKEAFRLYDKEGRGYLTIEVLRDILHELDDKITEEDLDMMIDEIDADGSGTVDFEEFMEVMTGEE